ncbi:MAG: hypothetical protein HC881_13795 [Leptolyngbyaceae cyanobacterium SL_7_1]|nr:hypothetical protein [Leptolyngbyaceae cyanobacterium SL_7_1]
MVSLRLDLTEAVIERSSDFIPITTTSTANIDDARARSHYLIQQFELARAAGAPPRSC